MYVTNSSISMSSARRYASGTKSSVAVGRNSLSAGSLISGFSSDYTLKGRSLAENRVFQYDGSDEKKDSFGDALSKRWENAEVGKTEPVSASERFSSLFRLRMQCVNYLLDLLFGRNNRILRGSDTYFEDGTGAGNSIGAGNASGAGGVSGQGDAVGNAGSINLSYTYTESEDTSFSTTGKVVTSDGRSIDFNIELTMSRRFMEESSAVINFEEPRLTDPLVINLDAPATAFSDQKFFFDLDGDGHEEYISKLGSGSGFLALDKDGNGHIDNGRELFGTSSGNGFYDLSAYDEDGNGWIDEADEIFDKLLIWSFDENGNEVLTGLGKAGVGAIYLGSSDTAFSVKDMSNNTNALIRSTGMFLYENGGAGTVQQVDIAG